MLKLLDESEGRDCDSLALSPRWRGRECLPALASASLVVAHPVIYRRLCACKLYTYTSFMRAYSRRVIDTVSFEGDGFAAFTEMLLRAGLQGYKVAEIPWC